MKNSYPDLKNLPAKGKRQDQELLIRRIFLADSNKNYCQCPDAKPGIINLDPDKHLPNCHLRKKIARNTVSVSLVPDSIQDGYSLGIAL